MADEAAAGSAPAGSSTAAASAANMDAAVLQIREVAKWLIAAFAAVGVALAAGSQLSEIGSLSGWRLVAAFAGVILTLAGIAGAILFATRVLTPRQIALNRLVRDECKSKIGEEVRGDGSLLLGHGKSLKEFAEKRDQALAAENAAWSAYEAADKTEKKGLKPSVEKAQADRERIDDTLSWVISYARFLDVSALFRASLIAMFVAAAVSAIGIAGFAWAAHPEDKPAETEVAAVSVAPAAVEVELSPLGERTLSDALGVTCTTSPVAALALSGPANALEMVTIPSQACGLRRFVLTPVMGTVKADATVELQSKTGSGSTN
jgi:hypothetical protein